MEPVINGLAVDEKTGETIQPNYLPSFSIVSESDDIYMGMSIDLRT